MATDLQDRNIAFVFQVWDTNDTGELTWADYQAVVDRLANEAGISAGSAEFNELTEVFRRDWEELTRSADKDANASITLDEWNAYHRNMISTEDGYRVAVDAFADLILQLVDEDNDGVITKSDYAKIFRAFNIDPSRVDQAFDKLDRDNDDRISGEEIRQATREYFRPSGPDAAGNWLFGSPQ